MVSPTSHLSNCRANPILDYQTTACEPSTTPSHRALDADAVLDAVNVYVVSGPKAARLCRFSQKDIEEGSLAPVIEYTFPAPKARKGKKKAAKDEDDGEDDSEGQDGEGESKPAKKKRAAKDKGKQANKKMDEEKDTALGSDEDEGDEEYPDYMRDDDLFANDPSIEGILPSSDPPEAGWAVTKPATKKRAPKKSAKSSEVVDISD